MNALLFKAWLETRVRFLAGLAGVAIICIFQIEYHHSDNFSYNFSHSGWAGLGIPDDYGFFLWQYLYVYFLQQGWALFAVLLALDGLIREKASGTVSFSLGLPVSRKRWMFTRLAVVLMESAGLSLFAVLVVIVGSAVTHQTFSLSQVFLHAVLMVTAGVIVIALGNLCYALFPGNYRSLLVALALLGVPYLWIQRHVQRARVTDLPEPSRARAALALTHHGIPHEPWWAHFDLAHAMAGPWQLNLATAPWVDLLVIWTLTALVLAVTAAYGDRVDYWRRLALGGLRREKATGAALFSRGLPVTRMRLFLSREAAAGTEAIVLGLVAALLIPIVSFFVGESYPFDQALAFGALMSVGGLVIVAIGLLLSEMFEGEFTAAAAGLCALTTIFLSYKAETLSGWNVFDVMSATSSVDPTTRLLNGSAPWLGLTVCLLVSIILVSAAGVMIRGRDM